MEPRTCGNTTKKNEEHTSKHVQNLDVLKPPERGNHGAKTSFLLTPISHKRPHQIFLI